LFRVLYRAHVGAVRASGGSCSTGNGALFVASQKGVQHRQTYAGLSGKFLDVGSSYRKGWKLARETDKCISGAHVGVASAFWNKGVSANEKYDGEANSQEEARYARHASLLSAVELRKNGTFDSCAAKKSQNVNKMPAVPQVKKNVRWNTRARLNYLAAPVPFRSSWSDPVVTLCAVLVWVILTPPGWRE